MFVLHVWVGNFQCLLCWQLCARGDVCSVLVYSVAGKRPNGGDENDYAVMRLGERKIVATSHLLSKV